MTTNEQILKAFDAVKDVGSDKSITELGWLKIVSVKPPKIVVRLILPDFAQSQRPRIANEIRDCIKTFKEIEEVQIEIGNSSNQTPIGQAGHGGQGQGLNPIPNVKNVIAKIDTGANLASIDASDIKIVSRDKVKYVKFKVMKRNNTVRKTSAPLEGYKRIKSSNGDVERRPYIKTTLLMDGISKKIELTLTDRGPMDYTMLIGRKALGKRWDVNPSMSFLTKSNRKLK